MIDTILWDFDGVILESVNVKTEAFYDMYLPYGEAIAKKAVAHHVAHGGVSRFEKFKIYHKEFLGKNLTDEDVEQMAEQFSQLVLNKVVASAFVEGSEEFIVSNHNNYAFYIISGTPDGEMKEIVRRKELDKYFLEVMGSPKKKYEWVRELRDAGKVKPETTMFIGDAKSDFEAAKKHNLKFILRETEDNAQLFADFKGPKIKNLTTLSNAIGEL